ESHPGHRPRSRLRPVRHGPARCAVPTKGGVMSAPQPPIIDQQTVEEIEEIKTLMAEAYRHALSIDGYAKSSEGRLSLDVLRPWYWRDGNSPRPEVSIYSYVLPLSGGGRQHYYDNA